MPESRDARADILAAVRRAGARGGAEREADYAAVARGYDRTPTLDRAARLSLFVDRLEHYDVGVRVVEARGLPAAVAEVALSRGRRRLVIAPDLPDAVRPAGLDLIADAHLSYDALDRCEGVLTTASIAIALTGTIVLTHTAGEGRRALTLIPDYHLCVVRADQIVETVPEAFARLTELQPALVTTISGPSATADIEMIRVRGVHGPRTLDVVVVG